MLLSLPTALLLEMCKISRIVRNHRLLNIRTLQHLHHTATLAPHQNTCHTNFTTNIGTLQHLHQKYYRKLAMGNTMHSFLAYTCAFVLGESEI